MMTVPGHMFEKTGLEGNFLIPADKSVRVELRQKLETYVHTSSMRLPGHEKALRMIIARVRAIEAYDAALGAS